MPNFSSLWWKFLVLQYGQELTLIYMDFALCHRVHLAPTPKDILYSPDPNPAFLQTIETHASTVFLQTGDSPSTVFLQTGDSPSTVFLQTIETHASTVFLQTKDSPCTVLLQTGGLSFFLSSYLAPILPHT
jgi:hypothetical protein